MKNVVIIGNGISGITAARSIRKRSDFHITVISSETKHFYSRTALMYIYMGHLKFEHTKPYEDWFWKKNKIDTVFDHVEKIEPETKSLHLKSGKNIQYDILIIATGSQSNSGEFSGKDLKGVQSLYGYQDLELMESNTKSIKQAVIVGGGLIGVEMAEMLRSRKIDVTIIVREPEFWSNVLPKQEARMISRHISSHHVNLLLNTELDSITGDSNNTVSAVKVKNGDTIPCQFVGLTIGVSPNIHLVKNSAIKTRRGILVNQYLQTNIEDVYAIGDCTERSYELPGRKNIEQVWYTGRMMGEVVAQTICAEPTKYEPGPWFNSAKFFDIEYQTYGNVNNQLKENEAEFYWEHISGRRAVHIAWDKYTEQFLGINSFGIRYRHENFDKWLRDKRDIHYVIQNLSQANFDPEFSERYEKEIQNLFNEQLATPQLK